MRRSWRTSRACRWLAALLAVLLLAGCAGAGGTDAAIGASDPPSGSAPETLDGHAPACENTAAVPCRIVDGADEGTLLLAAQDSKWDRLFRLTVGEDTYITIDNKEAAAGELRDGMLVSVVFGGDVMESYPALFGGVIAVNAVTAGLDDRCGLALQVLDDLWAEDTGLNSGAVCFGFDIDEALIPQQAEREAVAWRFAELHGAEPLLGTWQQLADEGYIDADDLYWEDGIFFSITAAEGKAQKDDRLYFNAEKWRSGLGAFFYVDCTARRDKAGSWTYEPGGFAVA